MADRFTEQLSPYLDGELDDLARARLEAHLGECLACAATLADLRSIVGAAPEYPGRAPSRDLWPAIEARLADPVVVSIDTARGAADPVAPARTARRFGWRELIAASIVMAAVGGGSVWLALQGNATEQDTAAVSAAAPATDSVMQTVGFADAQYESAVHDLEQLLEAGRDRLDSATIRTIEQSLTRIDAAIAEARAAIQRDPSSVYLSRQIAANMRRKLNLLRVATEAIAART